MKFNEKYQQLQREGDIQKLLKTFEEEVKLVLAQNSQAVSYQLAYDHVFKLTKANKQKELLELLDHQLSASISEQLQGAQEVTLERINKILETSKEVAKRLSEIGLFLDINYCQKVIKETLLQRLLNQVFRTFVGEPKALKIVASASFSAREQASDQFNQSMSMISQLDEKKVFFQLYLLPHYEPLLRQFCDKAAADAWSSKSLPEYIDWCSQQLAKQQKFAEGLAKSNKREGIEAVMSSMYASLVTAYKEKIYASNQEELFQKLTLPILELLKFGRGKQVEGHVQWFMKALEKKLDAIPINENAAFLKAFCHLYNRVALLLKGTQTRFQIHYRAIFTFEEWINNEKFQLPLRINLLLDNYFASGITSDQEFVQEVALLFKLLKQKNLFESLYRRTLITRLLRKYLNYDVKVEEPLLFRMEKECGEEWAAKIKAVYELFLKDRQPILKKISAEDVTEESNLKIGGLVPVVVPQNSWPYEERTNKIVIHPVLRQMVVSFQKSYLTDGKQRLWWTTEAGFVIIEIKFNNCRRRFIISVDAANLLLWLQNGPRKLAPLLCEQGYPLDRAEKCLRPLVTAGLITSKSEGNDEVIELAREFAEGPLVDLIIKGNTRVEVKVMEELRADRRLMVEAILVKIMKGEKLCRREELVQKSAPLVAQRGFKFNPSFVESSIDRLIDKQFIRDFENGSLGYIA